MLQHLDKHFTRIGARLRLALAPDAPLRLDVARDGEGEYFDLRVNPHVLTDIFVMDVDQRARHLLLFSRSQEAQTERKQRFLCGHDERAWFAAAVPGGVSNVHAAKEALKPAPIRALESQRSLPRRERNRRRNAVSIRQGEWFFLPVPNAGWLDRSPVIVRHEPLRRGAGKPHWCEYLVRVGGELVYVNQEHPNGLSESQYRKLIQRKPAAAKRAWMPLRRNPSVFVRGKVSHADHATIRLNGWHQVLLNTESQAPGARFVAFLD